MPALSVAAEKQHFEAFVGSGLGLHATDVVLEAFPLLFLGIVSIGGVAAVYKTEVAFLL